MLSIDGQLWGLKLNYKTKITKSRPHRKTNPGRQFLTRCILSSELPWLTFLLGVTQLMEEARTWVRLPVRSRFLDPDPFILAKFRLAVTGALVGTTFSVRAEVFVFERPGSAISIIHLNHLECRTTPTAHSAGTAVPQGLRVGYRVVLIHFRSTNRSVTSAISVTACGSRNCRCGAFSSTAIPQTGAWTDEEEYLLSVFSCPTDILKSAQDFSRFREPTRKFVWALQSIKSSPTYNNIKYAY